MIDLVQDAARMAQEQLAGLGQRDAAAVAHQQVLPQLHLQLAHLPAERRLRHVDVDRGAGEAAQFSHTHKIFELLQIHRASLGTHP